MPAPALLLAGATSVQFGAGIAATLFDDLGPSGVSLLRLAFSALVLVLVWRPRVRAHARGDLLLALGFGAALGTMNLTFYLALDRIPLGVAVTIEFLGPLAVAVLGSRRRLDLVWAGLAALGVLLLSGVLSSGGGIDGLGLLFVVIAGTCWALYIVLAQRAASVFPGGHGLAIASVAAAVVPIAPGIAEGGTALLHPGFLALGLLVALMSSVIPYSLETVALRRMPTNVFGVLMSLEPVIAAFAGLVVLGQSLGASDLGGMACVVVASIGVTRNAAPAPPPMD